eukprot:1143006-Pelagomonas_calceolata.AAC.1
MDDYLTKNTLQVVHALKAVGVSMALFELNKEFQNLMIHLNREASDLSPEDAVCFCCSLNTQE